MSRERLSPEVFALIPEETVQGFICIDDHTIFNKNDCLKGCL